MAVVTKHPNDKSPSAKRRSKSKDDASQRQAEEECEAWAEGIREFVDNQLIKRDQEGRPFIDDEKIDPLLDN